MLNIIVQYKVVYIFFSTYNIYYCLIFNFLPYEQILCQLTSFNTAKSFIPSGLCEIFSPVPI